MDASALRLTTSVQSIVARKIIVEMGDGATVTTAPVMCAWRLVVATKGPGGITAVSMFAKHPPTSILHLPAPWSAECLQKVTWSMKNDGFRDIKVYNLPLVKRYLSRASRSERHL
ncbi:uncharacterized protein BO80DRAFT_263407 [Aspergillus ibericus CBS 121593]|uniref:Uncharacterized protein n=1 Tax=Aspergillus ibericus CBS 121593 TaxID=1448316 RepID=A0A395GN21_9EURO|nr:hypothetical protein BO80DRAFT_263407 [Aspergillus ibericus CBS 121593]RAK95413.1 hypothetical protein BO80DRAFT_263407 [Aspergillus ibericus CBS 121593]